MSSGQVLNQCWKQPKTVTCSYWENSKAWKGRKSVREPMKIGCFPYLSPRPLTCWYAPFITVLSTSSTVVFTIQIYIHTLRVMISSNWVPLWICDFRVCTDACFCTEYERYFTMKFVLNSIYSYKFYKKFIYIYIISYQIM